MTNFNDIAAKILPCECGPRWARLIEQGKVSNHAVNCPQYFANDVAKALQNAYDKGVEDGIMSYRG